MKDTFLTRKEILKKDLNEARSRISVSFDVWTSPSCICIVGLVAHFINKTGKRQSTVLGLCNRTVALARFSMALGHVTDRLVVALFPNLVHR